MTAFACERRTDRSSERAAAAGRAPAGRRRVGVPVAVEVPLVVTLSSTFPYAFQVDDDANQSSPAPPFQTAAPVEPVTPVAPVAPVAGLSTTSSMTPPCVRTLGHAHLPANDPHPGPVPGGEMPGQGRYHEQTPGSPAAACADLSSKSRVAVAPAAIAALAATVRSGFSLLISADTACIGGSPHAVAESAPT